MRFVEGYWYPDREKCPMVFKIINDEKSYDALKKMFTVYKII